MAGKQQFMLWCLVGKKKRHFLYELKAQLFLFSLRKANEYQDKNSGGHYPNPGRPVPFFIC
jgi:hypothetical protein